MHQHLLIASSSPDEAMTRTLLKHQHVFNIKLDVVYLDALLCDMAIADELNDTHNIIRWFRPNLPVISNQTHDLLNRNLWISNAWFKAFIPHDRLYAKREFEAYLGYSLNAFRAPDQPTVNGLCGTFYSLPEQWQKIAVQNTLKTPRYYWGPKHLCDLTPPLVFSAPDDIYRWHPTHAWPKAPHLFCFEKPKGEPLLILSLGHQALLPPHITQTQALRHHIQKAIQKVRACFGYFAFELLLFAHENTLTFGCVNLSLERVANDARFTPFVLQHFMREYAACLH